MSRRKLQQQWCCCGVLLLLSLSLNQRLSMLLSAFEGFPLLCQQCCCTFKSTSCTFLPAGASVLCAKYWGSLLRMLLSRDEGPQARLCERAHPPTTQTHSHKHTCWCLCPLSTLLCLEIIAPCGQACTGFDPSPFRTSNRWKSFNFYFQRPERRTAPTAEQRDPSHTVHHQLRCVTVSLHAGLPLSQSRASYLGLKKK